LHLNKVDCVRGSAFNSHELTFLNHMISRIASTKLHIRSYMMNSTETSFRHPEKRKTKTQILEIYFITK